MRNLALLALLALASCGEDDKPSPKASSSPQRQFSPEDDSWKSVPQELIFNNNADPETLDPAIMTGVPEHSLALALYEGLTSHDPKTLEPVPGVAERWEVSADGRTYTFHLRANAKWSNGDPVTSQDFLWSWYRAIGEPECDYAYHFDYIDGAIAWRAGLGAVKRPMEEFQRQVGVAAPDPRTLVVRLAAPCAYFLDLCAFETFMPVHRATFEKHGEAWTSNENWVGNGPYKLQNWSRRQHIVMVKNPHYWDVGFLKLTKITALPVDDMDQAWNKFLKREVHWIRSVPSAKIDEAKRNPEYFVQPYLGTYFYRFNVGKCAHLADKRVRKALSMAVNRETITRDILRAGQIPAEWFCPAVAGYEPPKGFRYDPDAARALLAEAGYPGGKGYPPLTLFYNTHEDHKKVAESVAQMWRENLNLHVTLQNSEWKVYLKQVELLDYQVARAGWIGDYGDPMSFLDMWLTGGGNNNTGWSNPRYDELIAKARVEIDHGKRLEYFGEAERIVVEDEFPILPLYMYVNQGMKVDRLRGWYENIRDLHPFQYMYFEPE